MHNGGGVVVSCVVVTSAVVDVVDVLAITGGAGRGGGRGAGEMTGIAVSMGCLRYGQNEQPERNMHRGGPGAPLGLLPENVLRVYAFVLP